MNCIYVMFMHRTILFLLLILACSTVVSYFLDQTLSILICISITIWLVFDHYLVYNSVYQETVEHLLAENFRLKETILLMKLDEIKQRKEIFRKRALNSKSCKF
jgi:hypothetical protein